MRKLTLLIVLILFFSGFGGCSDRKADERLSAAEALLVSHPDSAWRILECVGDPDNLSRTDRAYYNLLLGIACYRVDKPLPDTALHEAYNYFQDSKDSLKRAQASLYMGRLAKQKHFGFRERLFFLLEAELFAPVRRDSNLLGLIASDLGDLHDENFETRKSLAYYMKAYRIFKQIGRVRNQAIETDRVGYSYLYMRQFDSALYYFREGLRINERLKDTAGLFLFSQKLNVAFYYNQQFDSSRYYLNKALALKQDTTPEFLCTLAKLYDKEGYTDSARTVLMRALSQFEQTKDTVKICGVVSRLGRIEEQEGNLKGALDYAKRYSDLKGRLLLRINKNPIGEIRGVYKNKLLEAERNRLLLEKRTLWLAVSLMLVILLAGLSCYVIAVSRRNRRILLAEAKAREQENQRQRMELRLHEETIQRQQTELTMQRQQAKLDEAKYLLMQHLDLKRHVNDLKQIELQSGARDEAQVERLIEQFSLTPKSWTEIARIIDQVYEGLPVGLSGVYSQLSEDDVRLCCMIIIGLSSAEIALVLGINTDSVYRKRRRLKKKINLGEKDSLREHLHRFTSGIPASGRA